MFEPADFLEQSLRLGRRRWSAATVVVDRPEIDRGDGWDAALARGRAIADMKVHGAAPAPYLALDLSGWPARRPTTTAPRPRRGADHLAFGEELRAGLYAFDLVQRRAKQPAGVPDKSLARAVTKVGVVGAGLMACQLALLFAQQLEVPVVLTDLDQERVDKGVGYVHAEVDKLLAKGRINRDKANRLKALVTGSTDKEAFADADFVIEAVFEEMKVKQQVFGELEAVVSPECVLATNTSSQTLRLFLEGGAHPLRDRSKRLDDQYRRLSLSFRLPRPGDDAVHQNRRPDEKVLGRDERPMLIRHHARAVVV